MEEEQAKKPDVKENLLEGSPERSAAESETGNLEDMGDSLAERTGDFTDAAHRAEIAGGEAGPAKVEKILGEASDPGSRDPEGHRTHVERVGDLGEKIEEKVRELPAQGATVAEQAAALGYVQEAGATVEQVQEMAGSAQGEKRPARSLEEMTRSFYESLSPETLAQERVSILRRIEVLEREREAQTNELERDFKQKRISGNRADLLILDSVIASKSPKLASEAPEIKPAPETPQAEEKADAVPPQPSKPEITDAEFEDLETELTTPIVPPTEPPERPVAGGSEENKLTLENLEKELGYVDIKPQLIFEHISEAELGSLQALMTELDKINNDISAREARIKRGKAPKEKLAKAQVELDEAKVKAGEAQAKIIEFYKTKLAEVLRSGGRENALTAEKITEAAQSINAIINQTIENEVISELNTLRRQKGALAREALKTGVVIGTTALLASQLLPLLGLAGAAGATVAAAGGSVVLGRISRKLWNNIDRVGTLRKERAKVKSIEKERDKMLAEFFANKGKLREQISAHISNVLREESNEKVKETLRSYAEEKNEETSSLPIMEAGIEKELGIVAIEFYHRAYNMISSDARYADVYPSEKMHMALAVALTLAQHERNDLYAQQKLEEMKRQKPGVFRLIEKYNYVMGGFKGAEADAGDSFWQKHKHGTLSVLAGTAVGIAYREASPTRVLAGAMAGGALGYRLGEKLDENKRREDLRKITQMIEEAEGLLVDLDLPPDKWEEIKNNATIVRSRLDLGLLNSDPLLQSRAENFLHGVQMYEISNSRADSLLASSLLSSITHNRRALERQMEEDIGRVGQRSKLLKTGLTMAGMAVGGAASLFSGQLMQKFGQHGDEHSTGHTREDGMSHKAEQPVENPVYKVAGIWPKDEHQETPVVQHPASENISGQQATPNAPSFAEKYPGIQDHDLIEIEKEEVASQPRWIPAMDKAHEAVPSAPAQAHQDMPSATEKFPLTKDPDLAEIEKQEVAPHKGWIPAMEKAHEAGIPAPAQANRLEDIIDSSKVSGSDSIWKSTREMVLHNPEKFGYHGDVQDQAALHKFAENQTANLVAELNKEQGPNLVDLVHSGDKVVIDFKDGQPHLSFVASSGIEAGHLDDQNMSRMFADSKFNTNIEHGVHVDPRTGDQYMEIKSKDGIYKVYDWDRDANPNVVMPDGHSQEMSAQELNNFMENKGILAPHLEAAPVADPRVKLTEFLEHRGSAYSPQLYEAAKTDGKLNDLLRSVLDTKSDKNLDNFVNDYSRDHHFTPDKTSVFCQQIERMEDRGDLDHYKGSMDDLAKSFDDNVIKDFKEIKGGEAMKWRPVRLGPEGQYALVEKYHSGVWPFRSDHYFVDTDGDGHSDFVVDKDKQLEQAFKKGYFDKAPAAIAEPAHTGHHHGEEASVGQPDEPWVPKAERSPWEPSHKTLQYSGDRPEAESSAAGDIPPKQVMDEEPKIIDTSDQVQSAATAEHNATLNPEAVKDVALDPEITKLEPVNLAVESINRGDPSLHFSLEKIQTSDLEYLSKVKNGIDKMLVYLKVSQGEKVRILEAGYKQILEEINKKVEKP